MLTVDTEKIKELLSSGKSVKFVDVRSKDSYEKEHIAGAISLPLDEIEKKAEKILRKDDAIVVYCGSLECQASNKATEKLLSIGFFKSLAEYAGGIKDYKEARLPLEGSLHVKCSYV